MVTHFLSPAYQILNYGINTATVLAREITVLLLLLLLLLLLYYYYISASSKLCNKDIVVVETYVIEVAYNLAFFHNLVSA
jgi:hypothetical protein